jgi:hypothetical protein
MSPSPVYLLKNRSFGVQPITLFRDYDCEQFMSTKVSEAPVYGLLKKPTFLYDLYKANIASAIKASNTKVPELMSQ